MIKCPSCQASLPDWAQECQFCKTSTKGVARPARDPHDPAPLQSSPKWVWPLYYALATYFMINGLAGLVLCIVENQKGFAISGALMGILGLVSAVLGLGLLFRYEPARGIVNFVCGLNIIFGLFALAGSVFGILFSGFLGVLLVLYKLLDLAVNGFLIFLIGETDKYAPT